MKKQKAKDKFCERTSCASSRITHSVSTRQGKSLSESSYQLGRDVILVRESVVGTMRHWNATVGKTIVLDKRRCDLLHWCHAIWESVLQGW